MKAYHNDQKIKDALIAQLEAHYAADEIGSGIYWENGKGCAVGCTVHSGNHADYEVMYGIPRILAYIEDWIFENLPRNLQKKLPLKFARAISVGANLSDVWRKFYIDILEEINRIYVVGSEESYFVSKVLNAYSSYPRLSIKELAVIKIDCINGSPYIAYLFARLIFHVKTENFSRFGATSVLILNEVNFGTDFILSLSDKLIRLLSECH